MIRELFDLVMIVVENEEGKRDTRHRNWVKHITKVDVTKANGYAFEVKWINEGTVDVEGPMVLLVKTTRGSRKYQASTYNVVTMSPGGDLSLTDIRTTDKDPRLGAPHPRSTGRAPGRDPPAAKAGTTNQHQGPPGCRAGWQPLLCKDHTPWACRRLPRPTDKAPANYVAGRDRNGSVERI